MVNRPHVFANLLDQAAARGQISRSEAERHPERESLTKCDLLAQRQRLEEELNAGEQEIDSLRGQITAAEHKAVSIAMADGPLLRRWSEAIALVVWLSCLHWRHRRRVRQDSLAERSSA